MTKNSKVRFLSGLLLVALSSLGSMTFAEIEEDMTILGFYVGAYDPDPAILDDDTSYGIRLIYMGSDRFGIGGQLGRVDLEDAPVSGITADFEVEMWLLDISFVGALLPAKRTSILYYGGMGAALNEINGTLGNLTFRGFSDDSLTLHAGIGVNITLSDRLGLQAGYRFRWFDKRNTDEIDGEITVGLGFRLGS